MPPAVPVVQVTVLLFSVLRERVGRGSLSMELPVGSRGNDLLDRLAEAYPIVGSVRSHIRLGINASYRPADTELHDGDEVALITPTSGG